MDPDLEIIEFLVEEKKMKVFVLMGIREVEVEGHAWDHTVECSELISVFADRSEADNKVIHMMELIASYPKRQSKPFWRDMKELGLEYRYDRLDVVEQELA